MKNIKQRLLIIALLFASTITFAQVGIGTETPLESSALDITSSDKGFLLPRMSSSDRTSINTSADAFGLQVYDIDTKSIWIFDGFQWNESSSKFVGGTNSDDAVFTEGNVGIGTADPEAVLDVVSTDSGFIMPRVANTAAVTAPVNGMMVYDMSSTCAKIYENGAWTDCLSSGGSVASEVVANCDQNGFEGAYVGSVDLTADNIFTVTITNNTFSTTDISLDITDLVLSGTALGSGSAVTVSSVSPSSVSLSAGESELVTYNLTGTPVTGDLEAEWTKINLSCVKTKTVGIGDATYTNPTNNQYVFSVNDTTLPLDSQGILAIDTTINVPYTGGVGAYAEYISPDVAIDAQYAEDGASNWTFGYSYEAGTYSASGDLVVTLIIKKDGILATFDALRVSDIFTINFDFVNLPLVVNGNVKPNTIGLDVGGGILNTNFMALENGAKYAISGANEDTDIVSIDEYGPVQYSTTFGSNNQSWMPGGAFYYDNGTSKTRPTSKIGRIATTWDNSSTNMNGGAYMVVDFGTERIINTIFAHQTNSDGRFTSVEVSTANSALPGEDPSWAVVKPFVDDEIGCAFTTAGTQLTFPVTVTRYIRYRFKNSGTCTGVSYIEVFGIGTFLHFD